jgi:hypothetical protein
MQSAEDVLSDDLAAGGLRRERCQIAGRALSQAIDADGQERRRRIAQTACISGATDRARR